MPVTFEIMNNGFQKAHLPNGLVVHFLSLPDNGDFHDHPFAIGVEIILGGYVEEFPGGHKRVRTKGDHFIIRADHVHRIIEILGPICVTHCRYGDKIQEPGFIRDGQRRQWNSDKWVPFSQTLNRKE